MPAPRTRAFHPDRIAYRAVTTTRRDGASYFEDLVAARARANDLLAATQLPKPVFRRINTRLSKLHAQFASEAIRLIQSEDVADAMKASQTAERIDALVTEGLQEVYPTARDADIQHRLNTFNTLCTKLTPLVFSGVLALHPEENPVPVLPSPILHPAAKSGPISEHVRLEALQRLRAMHPSIDFPQPNSARRVLEALDETHAGLLAAYSRAVLTHGRGSAHGKAALKALEGHVALTAIRIHNEALDDPGAPESARYFEYGAHHAVLSRLFAALAAGRHAHALQVMDAVHRARAHEGN